MVLASGDVPRPTGPAAQMLLATAWPGMSESSLEHLAGEQAAMAAAANDYGDQVMRDMAHQRELLKGHAGDAHQALMGSCAITPTPPPITSTPKPPPPKATKR